MADDKKPSGKPPKDTYGKPGERIIEGTRPGPRPTDAGKLIHLLNARWRRPASLRHHWEDE